MLIERLNSGSGVRLNKLVYCSMEEVIGVAKESGRVIPGIKSPVSTKTIDWAEPRRFKVVPSEVGHFRGTAVSIYRRVGKEWELVLPDMAPSVLRKCKFPESLCRTTERVLKKWRVKEDVRLRLLRRKLKKKPIQHQPLKRPKRKLLPIKRNTERR